MSRGTITYLMNVRGLDIDDIVNLREEVLHPSIAIDSVGSDGKHSKAILTNMNIGDETLVAYVRENGRYGNNMIVSSYARADIQKYMNQLKNQHKKTGGKFYVNEKTSNYLEAHGLQLPQGINIAGEKSIVQKFKKGKSYSIDTDPVSSFMDFLDENPEEADRIYREYAESDSPEDWDIARQILEEAGKVKESDILR